MAELASTLNRPLDPLSIAGQVSRQPSIQARGAEARRQIEPIMRGESEAASAAMRSEAEAARNLAREQATVEEQAARGMEEASVKLQDVMAGYPQRRVEDFDPNAGLEMAAMTALLGAFAGSVSGQAALTSMKGITEGYRTGKQDLYERSVKKYESDLQQYRDKIANAKTIFDNAMCNKCPNPLIYFFGACCNYSTFPTGNIFCSVKRKNTMTITSGFFFIYFCI